ncbi:hypothetical protein FXO38_02471 [Capsicum annuum]|nr:hypothetical protein FXO38_02471 [Capsicum annuum]
MKVSKGSKTHRSNKESNLVKSCSSNSGWFSSEGEDGETEDAIFSLSSGYFSESFRRKKYNQKSWETSRCSSELSANSVSTALSENRANGRAESNLNESKWVKSINGLDFAASRTEQNRGKVSRSARKTAGTYRKKYNQASSVMSRSSSELSMNSISTTLIEEMTNKRVGSNLNELKQLKSINDYYFPTSKTEQNRTTTSKTARRTAEKQTRSGGRTHRKIIPVENFDYYNECTSDTRRRTTKSHRIIKKLRSINSDEMGKFTIVVDGRIEESIAVEKNTSDPYSDFRTSMLEMICNNLDGRSEISVYFPCFDPSLACVYHLGIAWMNDMIPKPGHFAFLRRRLVGKGPLRQCGEVSTFVYLGDSNVTCSCEETSELATLPLSISSASMK